MSDILFLAHRVPYPPDRGDKIRSFNILNRLRELGTVHVATFADDDADMAHGETLRPMLGSMHIEKRTISKAIGGIKALVSGKPISLTMFESAGIRSFVEETLTEKNIEAVFVFSGQMAQFVPELTDTRFIMDFVDMDSAKFAQYADESSFPMSWVNRREGEKLFSFEESIAQRADYSLFVSNAETKLFRETVGLSEDRVRTLQNGIDCAFFDPTADIPVAAGAPEGPLIAFTGQMDYRPNIEAVRSFANEAFPLIQAARPDAVFAIVGRNPTAEVEKLAKQDGIIVTGSVPDIRSWLAAADVIVAPLRMARGIQNKVLEAMAMARPIVASPAAYEGIDAAPGRDLIVAQNPKDEAESVLALLNDPERAHTLGQTARARMLESYSWESTLAPLAVLIGQGEAVSFAEAAE